MASKLRRIENYELRIALYSLLHSQFTIRN